MHISNWSVSRSGAGLTVRGASDGKEARISDIAKIELRDGQVIAIGKAGAEHLLLVR